jgi:hypothetical protein
MLTHTPTVTKVAAKVARSRIRGGEVSLAS